MTDICFAWGHRGPSIQTAAPVPKRIWAYWHDPQTPDFILACVASWRRHAPDYQITLLNRDTAPAITGRIPFWVARRPPAAVSDWIRLKLLRDHGGLWMDASMLMLRDLTELLPQGALDGPDPFAFFNRMWSTDMDRPMIESWFIAAPPGGELLRRWLRAYWLACYSRKSYLAVLKRIYGSDRLFQNYPPVGYFSIFATLQALLIRHPHLRVMTCDSETGPYRLQAQLNYDPQAIAAALTQGPLPDITWIKLSGDERKATMAMLRDRPLSPRSVLVGLMP